MSVTTTNPASPAPIEIEDARLHPRPVGPIGVAEPGDDGEPSPWPARFAALISDLTALRSGFTAPRKAPAAVFRPGVLADDPSDSQWSQTDARFERVVHIFSQEWTGIRSAAAYAPGRKLALIAARPLGPGERRAAIQHCRRVGARVAILHSYSPNLETVAKRLRRDLGLRLYGVWHGSSAQFHNEYEYGAFNSFLRLHREGLLDGIGAVKPGMHLVADRIHPETLLNFAPRIAPGAPAARLRGAALVPIPVDWRKNFHTNVFAASAEPRLRVVYATSKLVHQPESPFSPKVIELPPPDRAGLFELLRTVDVVLNATLSECQPMVALEALARRVPCLTPPLGLGELDRHPYQRWVQTAGADTLTELRAALGSILDRLERSPIELHQAMSDYSTLLYRTAVERLGSFVQP